MQTNGSIQTVIQNLRDAGCDAAQVRQFLLYEKEGKLHEQLKLLAIQREYLLDRVHRQERQIDCLDYLVYRLTKSETTR